jgi:sarcosine oxidase subunit gamma
MADPSLARTALDPHADTLAALPFQATELRLATQLSLRVAPGSPAAARVAAAVGVALPTVACTSTSTSTGSTGTDAIAALWLGPDEWLLVAAPGRQQELTALIRDAGTDAARAAEDDRAGDGAGAAAATAVGDPLVAVTDVSAQRVALRLSGPLVPALLARGCAIDLHPSRSPAGTCVQTLLAQTGVILVVEQDFATEVLLLVRTSFVDYLIAWMERVGAEIAA